MRQYKYPKHFQSDLLPASSQHRLRDKVKNEIVAEDFCQAQ